MSSSTDLCYPPFNYSFMLSVLVHHFRFTLIDHLQMETFFTALGIKEYLQYVMLKAIYTFYIKTIKASGSVTLKSG